MVKILHYDITREGFTRHGQHLNSTGKSKLAQLIAHHITRTSINSNTDSIPMKWNISTSDFIPTGCEPSGLNKEICDLDNEPSGLNKEISHLDSDGKEINQPTTNNQNIRASNRRKKSPLARSHHFLWGPYFWSS